MTVEGAESGFYTQKWEIGLAISCAGAVGNRQSNFAIDHFRNSNLASTTKNGIITPYEPPFIVVKQLGVEYRIVERLCKPFRQIIVTYQIR